MSKDYMPGKLKERPDLFGNDAVLPLQYFGKLKNRESDPREVRLMLAVLEEALDCYQRYLGSKTPQGRELFREASEWIDSRDDKWIFSYENICDVVGLDADNIREGLREYFPIPSINKRRSDREIKIQPLTERLSALESLEN